MRKLNKNKIALILLFAVPLYLSAADNETDTSTQEAKESTTNQERNVPSSQKNRMRGLITKLSQNNAHEIETLQFNNEEFLALFRDASTGDTQGCIILLHGDNEHPDWPSVINPIRTKLNENSWCTLSIEVPDVYPKESLTLSPQNNESSENTEEQTTENNTETALPNEDTIFGRIDTAIDFLSERDFKTFTILGHRTGASYALKYTAEKELKSGALVIIAPISPSNIDSFELSKTIEKVQLPILDYYFDVSMKEVRFAQERQSSANRRQDKNLVYQQIKAFRDQRYQVAGEKRLTQRVWGFLKQNTVQQGQRRPLPSIEKGLFHQPKF